MSSRVFSGVGIGREVVVGDAIGWWPEQASAAGEEPQAISVEQALQEVADELGELAASQKTEIARSVLLTQQLMVSDDELLEEIRSYVDEGKSDAEAVVAAFSVFRDALNTGGEYFKQRTQDINDLEARVLDRLRGVKRAGIPSPGHPFVLVAKDLAPADTAQLDLTQVLGFVTVEGGPTSHTAIVARALGVPAIVGCRDAQQVADGTRVVVDAWNGLLTLDPTEEMIAKVRKRHLRAVRQQTGPGQTRDGRPIPLLANIGTPQDCDKARKYGAEGIGLLRTEFMFADRDEAPSLQEQTEAYSQVLTEFAGSKVVARVLDAGADKPLEYLPLGYEPNPALGRRGLRALRDHRHLLRAQLATLAKAQELTGVELWVMAPMVADIDEASWFAQSARNAGIKTVGVMVEIPSAALTADHLFRRVDFVSIGTNDLGQYTMAADRMLGALGGVLDPWSPAVLKLVQLTAKAGLRANKPVSVCGEAAADPLLACALVGVGVTSLSMTPSAIPHVREALAETSYDRCQEIAQTILDSGSAARARRAVAELPSRWRH